MYSVAILRDVMVIVQITPNNPQDVEEIKTSDLKPYEENTRGPYVTGYLKASAADPASKFVIGQGNTYHSTKETYFNRPLERNTSYIVFLRYFESQVNIDKVLITLKIRRIIL